MPKDLIEGMMKMESLAFSPPLQSTNSISYLQTTKGEDTYTHIL